jgi:hypothetical protein
MGVGAGGRGIEAGASVEALAASLRLKDGGNGGMQQPSLSPAPTGAGRTANTRMQSGRAMGTGKAPTTPSRTVSRVMVLRCFGW